jgi:hypothetical protein
MFFLAGNSNSYKNYFCRDFEFSNFPKPKKNSCPINKQPNFPLSCHFHTRVLFMFFISKKSLIFVPFFRARATPACQKDQLSLFHFLFRRYLKLICINFFFEWAVHQGSSI